MIHVHLPRSDTNVYVRIGYVLSITREKVLPVDTAMLKRSDSNVGPVLVEAFQQAAGLTYRLAGHVAALYALAQGLTSCLLRSSTPHG